MGAIILVFFIFFLISAMTGISMWVFIFLGIGAIIIYLYIDSKNEATAEKEAQELLEKKKKPYEEYSKKFDILLKKYKDSNYYLCDKMYHYSIIDNKIHTMFVKSKIDYMSIESMKDDINQYIYNIDDIKYYKLEGSVYREQHITGGGGGGSSIKGAVVGGIIAGDAGAVVGSRKKVEEIKTSYEEKDDRRLEITFNDDTIINISYKFYDRLLDYIPEKDYDNYIANKKAKGRK